MPVTRTTLNQRAMKEEVKAALASILYERRQQDEKWGVQNHEPVWWLAILMEEVGELSQEILEQHFTDAPNKADLKKELIQVAAVALAMLEQLNRQE